MATRREWVDLKNDIRSDKILKLNFEEIVKNAKKFLDSISNINPFDPRITIKKLLDADTYLSNMRTLLKSLCSPQESDLIKVEDYEDMNENLGRVDSEVKKQKDACVIGVDKFEGAVIRTSQIVRINNYEKILKESADNLVFYPLKNAYEKFLRDDLIFVEEGEEDKKGQKQKKEIVLDRNKKLFFYLIYVELLHASETMGIWTGQRKPIPTRKSGITSKLREGSDESNN